MKQRSKALWLLVPALVIGCVGSTWAYRMFGSFWQNARTVMYSGIPGRAPNGQPWAETYREAMDVWNDNTVFRFYPDAGYKDPCAGYRGRSTSRALSGGGDLFNGADFRADVCGASFDTSTLAVTFTRGLTNSLGQMQLLEADIIFNARYSWDIYDGPPRQVIDFRRVAIHELGHALGLDHEPVNRAIMQPQVSTLSELTQDDIAGVAAIYSPGGGQTCRIATLGPNSLVGDQLTAVDDCRMRELFGGTDASFVDVYRIDLTERQRLHMKVTANGFDPVIIAVNPNLDVLAVFETDGCVAHGVTSELPPGSYYMLVNTYDQPTDCGSGEGVYQFSVSDSSLPVLGPPRTFGPVPVPEGIMFQGGASADGFATTRSQFAANESVDVSARITVRPEHIGSDGLVYVVAILDDGRSFMKIENGGFVPFSGRQDDLLPALRRRLSRQPVEVDVVEGLRGDFSGLAGRDFYVFIGYSTSSVPNVVYYPSSPLSFRLNAQ